MPSHRIVLMMDANGNDDKGREFDKFLTDSCLVNLGNNEAVLSIKQGKEKIDHIAVS